MNKVKFLLIAVFASVLLNGRAETKPLILVGPDEYQVLCISPNGTWACGDFNDFSYEDHAFRWNLVSGEIELLDTEHACSAWSINDDGVVAGTFTSTTINANHAPASIPGYWDGSWHAVELPEGAEAEGIGYGISEDGHYMCGSVLVKGIYKGYIWKDGKIYKQLSSKSHAMPYAISPDGQSATGWAFNSNRTATYWNAEGKENIMSTYQSPWSAGRRFSPDGKKIVFFGGWDMESEVDILRAIYNVETGEVTNIIFPEKVQDFDLFDISNDGLIAGSLNNMAYLYKDGQSMLAYPYLKQRGVDFTNIDMMTLEGDTMPTLFRTQSLSADGNSMALLYYSKAQSLKTMIVRLNQDVVHGAPANLVAKKMKKTEQVKLSWKAPLGVEGIKGYNVYRDGKKVNSQLVANNYYFDELTSVGTYTYKVGTRCSDDTEVMSEEQETITVEKETASAPTSLYARQKGVGGALLQWGEPLSNQPIFSYVNYDRCQLQGFGIVEDNISFEAAISIDKEEMGCYGDYKLSKVTFYPMSAQSDWTLNVYSRAEDGTLTKIYTQPITQTLNYGQKNIVKLNTPVALPATDMLVAIQTTVQTASTQVIGIDYGHTQPGYGDLLRLVEEPAFYSITESSTLSGYPYYSTWMIEAILQSKNDVENSDVVSSYKLLVDGKEVSHTTNTTATLTQLSEGEHTIGVKAVFATGEESKANETKVNIVNTYQAVKKVNVAAQGSSAIHATWETPKNSDDTWVSYAIDTPGSNAEYGVTGPAENNYGLMAAVDFSPSMLRGYEGYEIKSMKFYPTSDAVFTLMLIEDNKQVLEQEVTNYVLNQWNEVELDRPVTVKKGAEYLMVIDCYDVTPNEAPLAVDVVSPYKYMSDLYSLDGETWGSITDAAIYGNWMMGMTLVDGDAAPLTVAGYDIEIDGVKRNSEVVKVNSYDFDFGAEDAKHHSISVNTYYPALTKAVTGQLHYFYIGAASIDEVNAVVLQLHYSNNMLIFEGTGVENIMLYTIDGKQVLSAKGNTVSIDQLASGIYVVKAKTADKELVKKIDVRR